MLYWLSVHVFSVLTPRDGAALIVTIFVAHVRLDTQNLNPTVSIPRLSIPEHARCVTGAPPARLRHRACAL